MKAGIIISSLLALSALTLSCESDNAMAVLNQEEKIDKYISANFADYDVVRNGGSNRVILVYGSAVDTVAPGDSVTVMIDGYVFITSPSTQFVSDSTTVVAGGGDLVDGLGNGLVGAGLGEESYILFSAKYGYYKESVGAVPAMSALMFHTLVTQIKKK